MRQSSAVVVVLALVSVSAAAQITEQPLPAAPGVVGPIGLDGTIDKVYSDTRSALVKTASGLSLLVHLTDRTTVHGSRHASEDVFETLHEGDHVVVHYVMGKSRKTAVEIDHVGDGGLQIVEAQVEGIDRRARTLTVRLLDGTVAALRLTERAARDIRKDVDTNTRVSVYYADEQGAQVAHYFKKIR